MFLIFCCRKDAEIELNLNAEIELNLKIQQRIFKFHTQNCSFGIELNMWLTSVQGLGEKRSSVCGIDLNNYLMTLSVESIEIHG